MSLFEYVDAVLWVKDYSAWLQGWTENERLGLGEGSCQLTISKTFTVVSACGMGGAMAQTAPGISLISQGPFCSWISPCYQSWVELQKGCLGLLWDFPWPPQLTGDLQPILTAGFTLSWSVPGLSCRCQSSSKLLTGKAFWRLFPHEERPSHGVDSRFSRGPVRVGPAEPSLGMRSLCHFKAAFKISFLMKLGRWDNCPRAFAWSTQGCHLVGNAGNGSNAFVL